MWVKICGNTNLEDALYAAKAGADALGFIFAESPRRVTASQVGAITANLPEGVEKIGVFADAPFEDIVHAVREGGLTGVQLHTSPDAKLPVRLRTYFGPALKILRVVHYTQELKKNLSALQDTPVDGVLIDSRTATAIGGTGITFDWQAARSGISDTAAKIPVIVAGGLNAENVAEAIRTLRPWGVDVSSGVETAPGRKDPVRVKAFIEAARAVVDGDPIA